MELIQLNNNIESQIISEQDVTTSRSSFLEANTEQVTLSHLKNDCIVPVYRDNEMTISHAEFIQATKEVVEFNYSGSRILDPNIRVSHIMKGRIPSAIGKPVKELLDHEKTTYYQRTAFIIEIPSFTESVNGDKVSLMVGGVRALNQESLFSKRSLEKFKICIGAKVHVCTNLCISTDGLNAEIKVASISELKQKINELIQTFNPQSFLSKMERMVHFNLDELQFAHTIGKLRMFQHLSKEEKADKFHLGLIDTQVNTMVKEYYNDPNFSRSNEGSINMWNFYNLMTSANKSSYIDSNFERGANAFEFVSSLCDSIENQTENWFLN